MDASRRDIWTALTGEYFPKHTFWCAVDTSTCMPGCSGRGYVSRVGLLEMLAAVVCTWMYMVAWNLCVYTRSGSYVPLHRTSQRFPIFSASEMLYHPIDYLHVCSATRNLSHRSVSGTASLAPCHYTVHI